MAWSSWMTNKGRLTPDMGITARKKEGKKETDGKRKGSKAHRSPEGRFVPGRIARMQMSDAGRELVSLLSIALSDECKANISKGLSTAASRGKDQLACTQDKKVVA
eukprot:1158233-Pelagomonas_calceolata.AAC.16